MEGDRGEPHRERTGWQMVGGAYGIRRKNERSLRAGVRELEGGQGGLWGVVRGKGNKKSG